MHFLVIPKKRNGLTRLSKASPEHKALLGHLMWVAQHVAMKGACRRQGQAAGLRDMPTLC